jgi:hypothetical protein
VVVVCWLLSVGAENTKEHRIYFEKDGVIISPWHDIPLLASNSASGPQVFNMIVEIPRWTNAKKEVCKAEPYNPIKQDIKKGKLRFVRNCFPHHGYPFTYGAIPQVYPYSQKSLSSPAINCCGVPFIASPISLSSSRYHLACCGFFSLFSLFCCCRHC